MKCPNEGAILEDWRRSQRGEPMLYASHIADCEQCRVKMRTLATLREKLSQTQADPGADHLDGQTRLAYVEKSLPREDRMRIEKHIECCAECRRDVMDVILAGEESLVRRTAPTWWSSLVRGGGLAFAGAALTVAFLIVCPILPNQQAEDGVAVYGTKGASHSDAGAALKAISPTDQDLDFAIAVWRKVVEMNPNDKLSAAKLAELENRLKNKGDGTKE